MSRGPSRKFLKILRSHSGKIICLKSCSVIENDVEKVIDGAVFALLLKSTGKHYDLRINCSHGKSKNSCKHDDVLLLVINGTISQIRASSFDVDILDEDGTFLWKSKLL